MNSKKRSTRFRTALAALFLMLALSACGGSGAPSAPPASTLPAEDPAANSAAPPEEQPADTEASEPEQTSDTDELLLGFDFPNSGVQDDGTNSVPTYTVTLHGGAELELQKGMETQILKLDGFGRVSDSTGVVAIPNVEGLLEVTFDANLSADDITATFRKALDLRDDTVVELYSARSGDVVYPGEFASVEGMDPEYGHMIAGASITVYNGTAEDLPLAEAPVVSTLFVTTPHDDSRGMDMSPAADVYARFGEPACVRVSWDDSSSTLKSVDYYWKCSGFYVQYSAMYFANGGSDHGSDSGVLRCFLDDPAVVEHYMPDAAAFMVG